MDQCVVTISAAESVTANFTLGYLLTVIKVGTGSGTVTSDLAGIDCGVTCTHYYSGSPDVTLSAVADTGSDFTSWNGAGCSVGTCLVTMSKARTITATFTLEQYALTVVKSGTGSGTVTSVPVGINCGTGAGCQHNFDYNTVVTLTATTDPESNFAGWSGAGCSLMGDCVVTINAAETVTATFELAQHTLTVTKDGTGTGTVTSVPAGIDCGLGAGCQENFTSGTVVTLTAAADPGSIFAGWSSTDVSCPGLGQCVVEMDANKVVTATFTQDSYSLTVNIVGNGTVEKDPDQATYHYGDVVTLTATPAAGWGFFGWSGALLGATNPITITMDGPKTVTATFKQYFVYLPSVRLDPPFFDDFKYADTSEVWTRWDQIAEPNATWFVEDDGFHGKHVIADRNAKAVAKLSSPQMPSSYSVEAKMKLATGSAAGSRCGLLFDFLDNTRTYRFVIIPDAAPGVNNWLVQRRNPTQSRWDTLTGGTGEALNMNPGDQDNLLRVERLGTSISVYLNGVQLWTGTDSTFVNGRAGLNIGTPVGMPAGASVEIIFDDFMIDNLP